MKHCTLPMKRTHASCTIACPHLFIIKMETRGEKEREGGGGKGEEKEGGEGRKGEGGMGGESRGEGKEKEKTLCIAHEAHPHVLHN